MTRRWMNAVIETSKQPAPPLSYQRGARGRPPAATPRATRSA